MASGKSARSVWFSRCGKLTDRKPPGMVTSVGYSYQVFAVDFAELKRLGKGDQALYEKLAPGCAEQIESVQEYLDEAFEFAQDDEDDDSGGGFFGAVASIFGKKKEKEPPKPAPALGDKPITGEEALRHLILGGDFVSYGGTAYGYLFESICEQIGERMDNEGWCSLRSSSNWDGEIEKALKKSGVKFPFRENLMGRGGPIDFPQGDDFPYMGHFSPEECKEFAKELANLDPAAAGKLTIEAEYGEISIRNLKKWMDHCAASNLGLVTFYY